jgi:hypothetical protein
MSDLEVVALKQAWERITKLEARNEILIAALEATKHYVTYHGRPDEKRLIKKVLAKGEKYD